MRIYMHTQLGNWQLHLAETRSVPMKDVLLLITGSGDLVVMRDATTVLAAYAAGQWRSFDHIGDPAAATKQASAGAVGAPASPADRQLGDG
jgi:hypothetical protein